MNKIKTFFLIFAFISFSALSWLFLDLLAYGDKRANADNSKKLVVILPGQNLSTIASYLNNTGIIKNPIKFKLLARIKGCDKKIKAGEYLLSSSMPPIKILETMASGKVCLYKITIPEGYNLKQVASIIAKAKLCAKADFLKAAINSSFVYNQGINAETFEGYLFPETYYFPKNITPKKIIDAMVEQFRSIFTPEWEKRAKDLNLSIHQVVTLASIIEKETGVSFERPVISSVFHNRLKKRMRLESDPTVIYGLKNFDGNITRKHLTAKTPYNTYTIKGLPPGPIANPGSKAIKAALYPADTDFLYFVSKKDKTHKFSTNIKDHNKAVRRYQLRK
ncbi:MAG: endolytic transglycosylase MltG [Thermodesulfobacteriota bacterium]|nr:endolytic transglycosylase MltG [Thermodesulfobacteriota bacterium]